MKKRNRNILLVLALTAAVILAAGTCTYAVSMPPVDGGTYTFDGSEITSDGGGDIGDTISGLEPGDSATITLTYTNDTDDVTEWYMTNDVVKSLEDSSKASGGGYTYKLTNVGPNGAEQEIFNSDAVGGDSTEAGVGLHQADNATEEMFFIQELAAGESGQTVLNVALDGESQANAYQNTDAEIDITYAVELKEEGETVYKHVKHNGSAKTGDDSNLLLPLLLMALALLLMILAARSYRKDRKDGVNDEQ